MKIDVILEQIYDPKRSAKERQLIHRSRDMFATIDQAAHQGMETGDPKFYDIIIRTLRGGR